MDSNFLEQFERVRGLMFAAGPSGFLGFWSTLVKFSKLSHIQTTIWRPPKTAPPCTAGSAGPFVTPLGLTGVLRAKPAKCQFWPQILCRFWNAR